MNQARPRFATPLPVGLDSWHGQIREAMSSLGQDPMPWQDYVALLIGARRADGRPRFKTVAASVPRQMGKTILSRGVIRARAKQAPDLDLYGTAQTRDYAAKHVLNLGDALPAESKTKRGKGDESVTWANGSCYRPLAPNEGGGHGDSIDFMLVDEGWTLQAIVLGGIRPAMIARPESQLLLISTMGTLDSTVWNDLVARGREAVDDPKSDLAYVEYSAPSDQSVFEDTCTEEGQPDCVWGGWMPALGITVMHEDIRSALLDVPPSEAIRAFGNRVTKTLNVVFPAEWVAEAWRVIAPPSKFVLAVAVNEEPTGATLATGHLTDEGSAIRLIEWSDRSPRWVPGKVREVLARRQVEAVVADFGSPARAIKAELEAICEEHNVPLIDRSPRDLGADTGSFYDALREGKTHIEKSEPLAESFAGAVRKDLGDLWVPSPRRMTVDASPLIATILAHGVATELGVKPVLWFVLPKASE